MSAHGIDTGFALDMQGFQKLKNQAVNKEDVALKAAAKQFEALFIGMMLKSMRDATPESGMFKSQAMDTYQGMMDQQWSQHLAGQGIGLADMLVQQIQGGQRQSVIPPAEDSPITGIPRTAFTRTPAIPAAPEPGSKTVPGHVRDFVSELAPIAQEVSAKTGVPAELILAQAALETGWGQYKIKTETGADSHNYFGIKAGETWQGARTAVVTHEYEAGKKIQKTDAFRVYASAEDAFTDYAQVISRNPRYQAVMEAQDAPGAARALQAGGYATDPEYAEKLIAVMETTKLAAL